MLNCVKIESLSSNDAIELVFFFVVFFSSSAISLDGSCLDEADDMLRLGGYQSTVFSELALMHSALIMLLYYQEERKHHCHI